VRSAEQFNALYDQTQVTAEIEHMARSVRRGARRVRDLEDHAFVDAVRSHVAVQKLMERHDADAVTIECLFLKHRKPCLSFAWHNGNLVPCGCENHLSAASILDRIRFCIVVNSPGRPEPWLNSAAWRSERTAEQWRPA
jgi:hypothetical protein